MSAWLLIPAVATAPAIVFVSRAAVMRGHDVASLMLLAHLLSAVTMGLAAAAAGNGYEARLMLTPARLWIPLVCGLASVSGSCLNFTALRQCATGPVTTITSLSIAWPMLCAFLFWGDRPGAWQWLGMALAAGGVVAMNLGKSGKPAAERYHWLALAVAAMVGYGVSQTLQKYVTVLAPLPGGQPRFTFMALTYAASAMGMAAYLQVIGRAWDRAVWPYACLLALGSMVQFVCLLPLLEHLPVFIVYLTFTGGSLAATILISTVFLRERYRWLVWIGCAVCLAGIVLMRLK